MQIYFRDQDFLDKLEECRKDPQQLRKYLPEPRFMECVVIAAGLDVPSASSVKARKREELMISSSEEEYEYSSSEDERYTNTKFSFTCFCYIIA